MFLIRSAHKKIPSLASPIGGGINQTGDEMKLPEMIRAAIEIGHRNGFVTFDQLDELVPPATTAPEDIEALAPVVGNLLIALGYEHDHRWASDPLASQPVPLPNALRHELATRIEA